MGFIKFIKYSVLVMLLSLFAESGSVYCHQFKVGGRNGSWTSNHSSSYNRWATLNRFHVADTLYFEYHNDSVLVVNYTSYKNCIVSDPISKFEDGNTVFLLDRYGFFYFISGQPGHCRSGQKLVVRVMVHSYSPAPAPQGKPINASSLSPESDWDSFQWGPPSMSSAKKLSLSLLCTALSVLLVLLYLLFL